MVKVENRQKNCVLSVRMKFHEIKEESSICPFINDFLYVAQYQQFIRYTILKKVEMYKSPPVIQNH